MRTQLRPIYEFGPFHLNAEERLLLKEGQPVPLTPKAFDTLLLLVENSGRLIDKDELMGSVWPDTVVEENNLNRSIYVLRKALGESSGTAKYIETVPKHGYRFVASVAEVETDETHLILERHTSARIITEEEEITDSGRSEVEDSLKNEFRAIFPVPKTHLPAGPHQRTLLISGAVAVAMLAVLIYFWSSGKLGGSATSNSGNASDSAIKGIRSIAVLPFRTLSASSDDEIAPGLGMADALITRLGSTKKVIVRPVSAISRYVKSEQNALEIGRYLGVDAVLEGSIQTSGGRLRATARLFKVSDGEQLWSGQFDEKEADFFKIQDSLSKVMAQSLALNLNQQEDRLLAKPHLRNASAYQDYQKGLYFFSKREIDKALKYFQQVVESETGFAPAYAKIG